MESQPARTRIFLPPSGKVLHEVQYDGSVVPFQPEPLPIDADETKKGVAASANGWLALPCDGGRRVLVVHVSAARRETLRQIAVPEDREATCSVVKGGWLFVATRGLGRSGPPALHAINLIGSTADWIDIPIPEQAIRYRREFDDLIVVGDELVALDNVLSTKQLFRFDISRFPQSELLSSDVFFSGSYAEADRVVCGNGWVAAKCSTASDGGGTKEIVLWSLPTWQSVGTICLEGPSYRRMQSGSSDDDDFDREPWERIEAIGNLLVFETPGGLAVLDVVEFLSAWRAKSGCADAIPTDHFTNLAKRFWRAIPSLRGPITALPDEGMLAITGEHPRALTESALRQEYALLA